MSSSNSTDSKIQKRGAITTYFLFPNYSVKVSAASFVLYYRAISDYIVVGHSVNGQAVGTNFKVGSPADTWTVYLIVTGEFPITLTQRVELAKLLNSESFTAPNYLEIGKGATSYNYSQTKNFISSGSRKIVDSTDVTTSKQILYDFRLQDREDTSIREFGLFNASSGGTMAIRYLLTLNGVSVPITLLKTREYKINIRLEIKDATPGDALVTDYALNEIRDSLSGESIGIPTHVEWSDGTSAIVSTDVSLDGSNKQRNAIETISSSRPPAPGYKVNWLGILTSAQLDGVTISKSGLFTASSGDVLFTENKFGGISKTTLFKVQEQTSVTVR